MEIKLEKAAGSLGLDEKVKVAAQTELTLTKINAGYASCYKTDQRSGCVGGWGMGWVANVKTSYYKQKAIPSF